MVQGVPINQEKGNDSFILHFHSGKQTVLRESTCESSLPDAPVVPAADSWYSDLTVWRGTFLAEH